MGYLSGSSPHIKSGAVSALSVLVYQDTSLLISVSGLFPSLLSLLQTKDVEIIKVSVILFYDHILSLNILLLLLFNFTSVIGCLGLC